MSILVGIIILKVPSIRNYQKIAGLHNKINVDLKDCAELTTPLVNCALNVLYVTALSWKTQEALGLIILFNEGYLCIDHN